MRQPHHSQHYQDDAYQWTQAPPTRHGLFDHHDSGKCSHACQITHANPEHDEHQRPTTAQAEPSMTQAKPPCRTNPLAVVVQEEPERRAAHIQAALLEGAELKE